MDECFTLDRSGQEGTLPLPLQIPREDAIVQFPQPLRNRSCSIAPIIDRFNIDRFNPSQVALRTSHRRLDLRTSQTDPIEVPFESRPSSSGSKLRYEQSSELRQAVLRTYPNDEDNPLKNSGRSHNRNWDQGAHRWSGAEHCGYEPRPHW